MSTTIQTPEGSSPVAATPAAAVAPSATELAALANDPIAFEKALADSGLSGADFDAALATPAAKPSGYTGSVPEAGGQPAPVVNPAATAPETPAAPEAATTPEDDNPQPEKLGKFRVTARDFKEAEFLRLAKSMPITEAHAKVYGQPAPAAVAEPAKPAATTPEAAPVADAAVTEAKAKLVEIEAKLTRAKEDADVGAIADLTEERVMTKLDIREAEKAARDSARSAQQAKADEATNNFRQREAAVAQEVYSVFPKLGDPASPERAEFQQFIGLKAGDPDYEAIFTSPRWPKVLANEFAEAKGWGKAAAPALPTGTPAPTPGAPTAPRVTAAEVLTPGSTQGGTTLTADTFVQDVTKMSLKDLDAILAAAR